MEESIKQQLLEKFLSIKETDHERYTELLGQLSSYYHAQCIFWLSLTLVMVASGITCIIIFSRKADEPGLSSNDGTFAVSLLGAFLSILFVFVFASFADKYHDKSSVPEAAFLIEYKK